MELLPREPAHATVRPPTGFSHEDRQPAGPWKDLQPGRPSGLLPKEPRCGESGISKTNVELIDSEGSSADLVRNWEGLPGRVPGKEFQQERTIPERCEGVRQVRR